MAKRSVVIIAAGLFLMVAGCQSPSEMVLRSPPRPTFNAPAVVAGRASAAPVVEKRAVIAHGSGNEALLKLAGGSPTWAPWAKPRAWKWIVVHHSATAAGGAARFDKMHRAKGWDELGYDFVIGNGTDTGDGQIEVGSRWPKQKWGAHDKTPGQQYNNYGIGICLVGNFDIDRPTAREMQSLARLCAYLMITYHITPDRVLFHRDTKATDCPGRNMHRDVVRRMAQKEIGAWGYDPTTLAKR